MAARLERRRRRRAGLSRGQVLLAAMRLADRDGIRALTMRRLGAELGVEAMTLYHYVSGKDDLLRGIVDLVMRDIASPRAGREWKGELRRSALSAHAILRRHPWACAVVPQPAEEGTARRRYTETVLQHLRAAGFSPSVACNAYHALESHIVGFTLGQAGSGARLALLGATLPLGEAVPPHPSGPLGGVVPLFAFGLDLILNGLARLKAEPAETERTEGATPGFHPRPRK